MTKSFFPSVVLITGSLFASAANAAAGNPSVFPADCWGVYSWGSPRQVSRQSHPLIKGVPTILRWTEVEPEPGVFRFDEVIGERLKQAEASGFYTFLKLYVAPHAPRWLYENGVPELKMTPTLTPLGQPRDWTFQHYLDEDYIRLYHRLLTAFGTYVRELPPARRARILFIQSAEGSTGDGGPYKGEPLAPGYHITDEQWGRFRIKAWEVMAKALTGETGKPVVPLLVNYDSNREEQYRWLLENLPVIGLKNGMFSHGYHISDTKTRLRNWQAFGSAVKAAGKEFFSRGEQDGEYRVYGWSTQNIAQGLYWSALFALHCGLDMWNVPNDACAGYEHQDAIRFFNKYAGHPEAASAPAAFCALRKGLDASDVAAYPEAVYGRAVKANVDRYLKIAEAFKAFGAIQGDPPKAIGAGMLNRKAADHNDVGWEIADGNFERFLTQLDPEKTSLGWWQKGPKKSIYSRFARSTDVQHGKRMLCFDLHDAFLGKGKTVEVRIVWLDERQTGWRLRYNAAGDPQKTALTITNTGSGEWREQTVVLSDFLPQNQGPAGADLVLESDGKADLVLHLIEVTKLPTAP